MIKTIGKNILVILLVASMFFLYYTYSNVNLKGNRLIFYYNKAVELETAQEISEKIEKSDSNFAFCFWNSADNIKLSSGTQKHTAEKLIYSFGQMRLAHNYILTEGRTPLYDETNGILVSQKLSDFLFPEESSVNSTLTLDNVDYIITGVFNNKKDSLAIINTDSSFSLGFRLLELELDATKTKAEIDTSLNELSLPKSDYTISYSELREFLIALLIPLFVLFLILISIVFYKNFFKDRSVILKNLVFFMLLFAFAILVPKALHYLPPNWIPNSWSDFSFWGDRLDHLKSVVSGLLSIPKLTMLKGNIFKFILSYTSTVTIVAANIANVLLKTK